MTNILDLIPDFDNLEVVETTTLTEDELRTLTSKRVKFAPEGAKFLGVIWEAYTDVRFYEKDDKYFHTIENIGD